MACECLQCLRHKPTHAPVEASGVLLKEMLGQERDVGAALAERWDANFKDAETEVQIGAETTLRDFSSVSLRSVAAITQTSRRTACDAPSGLISRSSRAQSS